MTNRLFLKANRHVTKLYKKWKDVDKVFSHINSNSKEVSRTGGIISNHFYSLSNYIYFESMSHHNTEYVHACMWNYTRNMLKYRLKRRMEKMGHNMA